LVEGLPEQLATVPAAIRAQQLAFALALRRGVDPDRPHGLAKVTRTV
jgi:glucosamine--fructose-6-phosphate aminotransferase (isomerizing)